MDLDAHCDQLTTAAVVTQKLREGATVEECTIAAKEFNRKRPPKEDGEKYTWGEKTPHILAHIKWLEERSIQFQQTGDCYKVIE